MRQESVWCAGWTSQSTVQAAAAGSRSRHRITSLFGPPTFAVVCSSSSTSSSTHSIRSTDLIGIPITIIITTTTRAAGAHRGRARRMLSAAAGAVGRAGRHRCHHHHPRLLQVGYGCGRGMERRRRPLSAGGHDAAGAFAPGRAFSSSSSTGGGGSSVGGPSRLYTMGEVRACVR